MASARAGIADLLALTEADPTPTPTPQLSSPGGFGPVPAPSSGPPATADQLKTLKADLVVAERTWTAFHKRYDDWRASGGACDQDAVRTKLRGFTAEAKALLDGASAVTRPSIVRPLAERLIDGAVLQSSASATLVEDWQPYDPRLFDAYAADRGRVDSMRRQVRSALDALDLELGIGLGG